jgi:hypothetical protein
MFQDIFARAKCGLQFSAAVASLEDERLPLFVYIFVYTFFPRRVLSHDFLSLLSILL